MVMRYPSQACSRHVPGLQRNIPIVRTAHVAALPDEPIRNKDGHSHGRVYLVELSFNRWLEWLSSFLRCLRGQDETSRGNTCSTHPRFKWRLMGFNAWPLQCSRCDARCCQRSRAREDILNMGIAIVGPGGKNSARCLQTFMDEEKRDLEELRRTRMATVQPDGLADDSDMQTTPIDAMEELGHNYPFLGRIGYGLATRRFGQMSQFDYGLPCALAGSGLISISSGDCPSGSCACDTISAAFSSLLRPPYCADRCGSIVKSSHVSFAPARRRTLGWHSCSKEIRRCSGVNPRCASFLANRLPRIPRSVFFAFAPLSDVVCHLR